MNNKLSNTYLLPVHKKAFLMNNKTLLSYLTLIIAPLFFGCGEPAEKENNTSVHGEKYIIDTKESIITWKGSMVLNAEEHIGYAHVSKGELMIEEGQLVGGTAEINLNTIEYKDKKNKNTPINHLKSPDYFDVEKFPISTFAITKVASVSGKTMKVTGNLTIKGVTRRVTFPADMELENGIANANGKLTIDRTDWGIRYRSGKFYDVLADQVVSDEIEFNIKIVARQ